MENEKRNYEMVVILSEKDNLEAAKKSLEDIFEKRGIEVTGKEDLGSRKLFHLASKQNKGFYQYLTFTAPGAIIDQLNKDIRVTTEILKCYITRLA